MKPKAVSPKSRGTTAVVLGILFTVALMVCPLGASGAEGGGPPPGGEVVGGEVAIPFSANITKDFLKNCINAVAGNNISANVEQIRQSITNAITAKAAELHDQGLIDTWLTGPALDGLVTSAVGQINAGAANIQQQIATGVDAAATTMKTTIDTAAPKAVVGGQYWYVPHNGWQSLTATTSGVTSVNANASFGLSFQVDLSVVVAGLSIPVSLQVNIAGTATFTADNPGVAQPMSPTTDAWATPVVSVSVSVSVSGAAGLTWSVGAGATYTYRLDPVHGTLEAGQYKH